MLLLKYLFFDFYHFYSSCLKISNETLFVLLEQNETIESLKIICFDIMDRIMPYPETFGNLKNLKKLYVFYDPHTKKFMKTLANSCENLEDIFVRMEVYGPKYLFDFLVNSQNTLKHFRLMDVNDCVSDHKNFHDALRYV